MHLQVFYIEDPANRGKHVVLPGKRHIVGVGNVVDEEEYDHADETPPFSTGIEPLLLEDNEDGTMYFRDDHEEGIWEKEMTNKKSKQLYFFLLNGVFFF